MKEISTEAKKLLIEIVKCKNIHDCKINRNKNNPCYKIVDLQQELNNFQVPEPWNGDIENAPILFLSINPAINENEEFPTFNKLKWDNNKIIDFFCNRFDGEYAKIINDNAYIRYKDGNFSKTVGYWNTTLKNTAAIMNIDPINVKMGEDNCIIEIVHCKTHGQGNLNIRCENECFNNYIEKILKLSKAFIIVLVGIAARDFFIKKYFKEISNELLKPENYFIKSKFIEGQNRYITFLYSSSKQVKAAHPNYCNDFMHENYDKQKLLKLQKIYNENKNI